MPLERDFDAISEFDIQALLDLGTTETSHLEFKRGVYPRDDRGKREFLKDISAFANTNGGHLILGVETDGGLATRLVPIVSPDQDSELLRLESLARDGLEPRLFGLRMKSVPLSAGGYAIVIRVPRSSNLPHRVTIMGTNRFFGRTSAGAYEFGVEELRMLFNSGAASMERAHQFASERIALVEDGSPPNQLACVDGTMFLHIVPLVSPGQVRIDPQRAFQLNEWLKPLGVDDRTPRYNFDGFVNLRGGTMTHGYTQVFRDGRLEATKDSLLRNDSANRVRKLPAGTFGDVLLSRIPSYLAALERLDVPAPLFVSVSLVGVYNSYLGVGDWVDDPPTAFADDILRLPPAILDQYGDARDYAVAMRPAFDALWNAAGFARCTYLSEEGDWHPPGR